MNIIRFVKRRKVLKNVYNFLRSILKKDSSEFKSNKKFLLEANTVLNKISDILDENRIDYWIDFGTLLGIIRDSEIIKWDKDIDIGVRDQNNSVKVKSVLESNGFKLIRDIRLKSNGIGLEQTYVYNDVSVDIFYYHEEEDYIISYVYSSFDNSTFDNCI